MSLPDGALRQGTEEDYDEIVAPMLNEVALKCKELGFHLVARVEWSPENSGITRVGNGPDAGVGQRLAYAAAMARGNIDALCMHAIKNFNCDQSIYLSRWQQLQREDR